MPQSSHPHGPTPCLAFLNLLFNVVREALHHTDCTNETTALGGAAPLPPLHHAHEVRGWVFSWESRLCGCYVLGRAFESNLLARRPASDERRKLGRRLARAEPELPDRRRLGERARAATRLGARHARRFSIYGFSTRKEDNLRCQNYLPSLKLCGGGGTLANFHFRRFRRERSSSGGKLSQIFIL